MPLRQKGRQTIPAADMPGERHCVLISVEVPAYNAA